jgi:hypothetical protein
LYFRKIGDFVGIISQDSESMAIAFVDRFLATFQNRSIPIAVLLVWEYLEAD